jgi:hypothetical protein
VDLKRFLHFFACNFLPHLLSHFVPETDGLFDIRRRIGFPVMRLPQGAYVGLRTVIAMMLVGQTADVSMLGTIRLATPLIRSMARTEEVAGLMSGVQVASTWLPQA